MIYLKQDVCNGSHGGGEQNVLNKIFAMIRKEKENKMFPTNGSQGGGTMFSSCKRCLSAWWLRALLLFVFVFCYILYLEQDVYNEGGGTKSCRRCPSACWPRALCSAEGKVCRDGHGGGHWDDGAGSVFVFVVGMLYSAFM